MEEIMAAVNRCIAIFDEIRSHAQIEDVNIYGRCPETAYIKQYVTVKGRTRLSDVRNTVSIWKYEKNELFAQEKDILIPELVVSNMYFDRAIFEFEISEESTVSLQYYLGPRYGRGLKCDIVRENNAILLGNERTIWVS